MSMENHDGGLRFRLSRLFCPINVEPLLIIHFISMGMFLTTSPAFIYFKTCTEVYEYRSNAVEFCQNLSSANKTVQDMVQKPASMFNVYTMLAYNVPSVFAGIYLGARSEVEGRKPALLIAIAGFIVTLALIIPVTALPHWPLWFLIPATVLNGLTGGGVVVIMASLSMITDLSRSPTAITIRISVGSACMTLGMVVGNMIGGKIMSSYSKPTAYVIAFFVQEIAAVIGFFYGVFFLKETVDLSRYANDGTDIKEKGNFLRDGLQKVKESFELIVRPRTARKRVYLNLGLLLFMTVYATDFGMPGLTLLFVKHSPLDWSDKQYDYMTALLLLAATLGFLILTPLLKMLRVKDSGIAIFGLSVLIGRQVLLSLSTKSWMVYTVASAMFFSSVIYPGFRAFLSKLVEKEETGRVFTGIGIAENVAPIFSGFMFNSMYDATVDFFPGFSFAFASVIDLICLVLISWIHVDSYYRSRMEATIDDQIQPVIDISEDQAQDSD